MIFFINNFWLKIQKATRILWTLLVLLSLTHSNLVKANEPTSIQTIDLAVSIDDIVGLEFGYHRSSFESDHIEYKLTVENRRLIGNEVNVSISILQPLLNNLNNLYPGTKPLYWNAWTDDYPHAWIYLRLISGEIVAISSDSQYDGMFPWNVLIWESEQAKEPKVSYIQLNQNFLKGLEALWRGVGESGFPRSYGEDSFFQFIYGDQISETTNFYHSEYTNTIDIWGDEADSLDLFLPLLNENHEIKKLLDKGYTIYDAVFSVEVESKTLAPIFYSGTLALATPDKQDVVIGLVTLPLGEEKSTTTFVAEEVFKLVNQRRENHFLNQTADLLGNLTFLIDIREGIRQPEFKCSKTRSVYLNGKIIEAIWNPSESQRVIFYPLAHNRWSIDFGIQRTSVNWDDDTVKKVIKSWFPTSVANIEVENLKEISTSWGISFQHDVTLQKPDLINLALKNLPEQTKIHEQNPEKDEDYSFLSLNGRVIVSENEAEPFVAYCGENFPDWYGSEYPIESVIIPNSYIERQDPNANALEADGQWHSLLGPLPHGERSSFWTNIAFTQPGFLHVLWTKERDGIYYADGWINGNGWSKPQRLGDDAYWLYSQAWPDGEIHLFWDAGLRTKGSIHVWKPAGGDWQKAEHWPIAYFSEILRDSNGVLHIGTIESDGLDSEFMHRTWSQENGLSEPENISRRVGNTGNTTTLLRFDSKEQLHAVWSHILDQKYAPDPITGETPDVSGIFYAYQMPNGHWSKPEQIGVLAPYAHALSMELDENDNPLVIWQTETGLASRIKENNKWQEPVELAKVLPPETPAEFGPDRQVQPTAELQTVINSEGKIIASWSIPYSGLIMASWSEYEWTNFVEVVTIDTTSDVSLTPAELEMKIDNQNQIHFVYYKNSNLYYSVYANGEVKTNPLGISYGYYGVPETSLLIDTSGSLAILGLPRSPRFVVKISDNGIPATPIPTLTIAPSIPSEISPTSIPPTKGISTLNTNFIGVGVFLVLSIFLGWLLIRLLNKVRS